MNSTWWVKPEELDDAQRAVIALDLRGNHLVMGPPGSGKTNLLLLRAKNLVLAGRANIQLLVFTRTLQEFLRSGAEGYSLSAKHVKTSRKWQLDFLNEHDVPLDLPAKFDDQRRYLLERIEEVIEQRNLSYRYDTILLDEAQDYLPEEIVVFKKLARFIFAVADNRQKLYGGKSSIPAIVNITGEAKQLPNHYRSGLQICELADRLARHTSDYQALAPTCNYKESFGVCKVDRVRTASLAEQVEQVAKRIDLQLRAYLGEMIGVIVPQKHLVTDVEELLNSFGIGDQLVVQGADGYTAFRPDHRVCLTTLHSAKGLEFRALHVLALETVEEHPASRRRNMYYTAVTRAKTALSLYHIDDLPGYVEAAIAEGEPRRRTPTVHDLFEKGTM